MPIGDNYRIDDPQERSGPSGPEISLRLGGRQRTTHNRHGHRDEGEPTVRTRQERPEGGLEVSRGERAFGRSTQVADHRTRTRTDKNFEAQVRAARSRKEPPWSGRDVCFTT
jgi:hypothetical protein